MLSLRETHSTTACEVPKAACRFCSRPSTGWRESLVVPSGLNYHCGSCLVSACWEDWSVAAGPCLESACLENWSAATESYLVFAMGLNCCPTRSSSLPENYCWTDPLAPYPNNFSLPLSLLGGGREERLNPYCKWVVKNIYVYKGGPRPLWNHTIPKWVCLGELAEQESW